MGQVLGEDHLDVGHDHLAPGRVGLLHDHPAIGIDAAKPSEGLVRPVRVDAVDVDFAVGVLEVSPVEREIEAELTRELPGKSDGVFVHEWLMQFGIEGQPVDGRRGGRGDDLGLEDAIAVGVVNIALEPPRRRPEGRDRIPAVDLLVDAPEKGAHHVAGIFGDEIRAAHTRADVGAVHALDTENVVEAADEISTNANIQRESLAGFPRVLHVDADVTVAGGRLQHFKG